MTVQKRQDIELLRILGCFGVVWIHSGAAGSQFAWSGLVLFLMLSIYLGGRTGGADVSTLKRRSARLLIPWLVWFVLYGSVNLVRGRPFVPVDHGLVAGILAGTSIHLWYIPFIFMCLVGLDLVKTWVSGPMLSLTCGTLACVVMATTPIWRNPSLELGYPLAQWSHATAAILFGIFMLHFQDLPKTIRSGLVLTFIALAICMIPYHDMGIPYVIGALGGLAILSKQFVDFPPVDLTPITACTFGIYLSHMFVLALLVKSSTLHGPLLPIATFVGSALLVASLRKAFPRSINLWS